MGFFVGIGVMWVVLGGYDVIDRRLFFRRAGVLSMWIMRGGWFRFVGFYGILWSLRVGMSWFSKYTEFGGIGF